MKQKAHEDKSKENTFCNESTMAHLGSTYLCASASLNYFTTLGAD
jgi:hypothetical protein